MKRPHLIFAAALVLFVVTPAYLLTLPTWHFTADAVNNLAFVADSNVYELWHPQHLLALWMSYRLHENSPLDALSAIRLVNALYGGATVALLALALARLTRRAVLVVGGALALWFSYGFWHYHGDPEIYAAGYTSAALLLWAYVGYLGSPAGTARIRWLAALAGAAALAILIHQLNVEFAGLIGVSLIWLASRRETARAHVVAYALVCALVPLAVYALGYLDVRAWYTRQDVAPPEFGAWALRYFGAAQAGDATWGVSLAPATLPQQVYAVALSWVQPPETLTPLAALPFVVAAAGAGTLLVALVWRFARRALATPDAAAPAGVLPPARVRLLAAVCAATLVANLLSGWWWQAGNVKFLLFMQLHTVVLIVLAVGWAHAADALLTRRLFQAAEVGAALLLAGLALAHVTITLPYETQGGIVAVADRYRADEGVALHFEDDTMRRAIRRISPRSGGDWDAAECAAPPTPSDRDIVWVVRVTTAAACPALRAAEQIAVFQSGREYTRYAIYRFALAR